MLIDKYQKDFHFNEVHTIIISETPEQIYPLLWDFDFGKSRIIKFLFTIRGLRGSSKKVINLKGTLDFGFILLEEKKEAEIVLGFIGRSWKLDYDIQTITPDEFISFAKKGYIKGAWNFYLKKIENDKTILYTETRVYCTDKTAKLLFSLYWLVISSFSRLIRRIMLRLIKREVEG
jgi:hypothetical protein